MNYSKKITAAIGTLFIAISSIPYRVFAEDTITLKNPLAADNPPELIALVVNILLGLSGSIALIYFVYGGILWMTSAGDKSKVTKGIDTMVWAAIGMAVIFASAAIVRFLLDSLLR